MTVHWSAYGVVPLITAALLAGLALHVWRRRASPAGAAFVALLGAVSIWLLGSGLDRLSGDLAVKVAASSFAWVGIVSVAPLALVATLQATGRAQWLSRRGVLALALPSALIFGLVLSNEWHGLIWSERRVEWGGPYPVLATGHGPAFWLHVVWAYALLLAAALMLVDKYRRSWSFYGVEAIAVLGGMSAPWIANVLYLSEIHLIPHADLTPYGFAVTAVALAWGFGRGRTLLDVIRFARVQIVEEMDAAALVVDLRDRLIYANRAAQDLLGIRLRGPQKVATILAEHPELARGLVAEVGFAGELVFGEGKESRVFLPSVKPLRDPSGALTSQVVLLRDITEHKQIQRRSHNLAYYDPLTGLPNRQRFGRVLARAIKTARRRGQKLALLFVDLDRFKEVNDTRGHEVGDQLLIEVAVRLADGVRFSDFVAPPEAGEEDVGVSRLGGDEFTVLLNDVSSPVDAARVARRLLAALEAPFFIAGHELYASASIGISVFPVDGKDPETLLRCADQAMYQSKRRGRNQYEFFTPGMTAAGSRRLDLEGRLRHALENDELSLSYQPIRNIVSGRVTAVEVLARWHCPRTGPVSPEIFVPLAEETGLIVPIGEWVLRSAIAQMRAWQDEGHRLLRLGVNLSGHQLRDRGLLEMLEAMLQEAGLSPAHLELEVTENAILRDDGITPAALAGLRELGVGLALDDFGTGYSSISYLRRFAFDRVKIDRSFIADVGSPGEGRALTGAIIAMAHGLQLGVVAEGVETHEQLLFLRDSGCDEVQGHLMSPALPAEDFRPFLEREKE